MIRLSDAKYVYHHRLVINVRLSNMMSYSIVAKSCNHEKVYLYIFDRQVKLRTPTSNGFFCVQTTQSLTIKRLIVARQTILLTNTK